MEPVDTDVEDVLEDVASVVSGLGKGEVAARRFEVRKTEEITYLVPGSWQNIADSMLALHQSLAPLGGGPAPGEIPATGGPAGALKRFVKRVVRKSVYWYVNPVVEQLHRTHAATDRALSGIAEQVKNTTERLEVMEKENLDRRISALEDRISSREDESGRPAAESKDADD